MDDVQLDFVAKSRICSTSTFYCCSCSDNLICVQVASLSDEDVDLVVEEDFDGDFVKANLFSMVKRTIWGYKAR
jgi:hypothetical protein